MQQMLIGIIFVKLAELKKKNQKKEKFPKFWKIIQRRIYN